MLKNIFFWIALCWTGVVAFFCLTTSKELPEVNIPNLDKLVHAFFHFVFTILWFLVFKKHIAKKKQLLTLFFVVCFSVLFGIAIEIIQDKCTTTRSGDFLDVLANVFGAMMAFGFVLFAKKIKKQSR